MRHVGGDEGVNGRGWPTQADAVHEENVGKVIQMIASLLAFKCTRIYARRLTWLI